MTQSEIDDVEFVRRLLFRALKFDDIIPEIEIHIDPMPKVGDVNLTCVDCRGREICIGDLVLYYDDPMIFLGEVYEDAYSPGPAKRWFRYLLGAEGPKRVNAHNPLELIRAS